MPRVDTKSHPGSSYRRGSPYPGTTQRSLETLSPLPTSPPPAGRLSTTTTTSRRRNSSVDKQKKHVCQTCERGFSTSGHLSRHIRIHTGERNHHCPFPGCDTKCSRQDNLQQHYKIHLSPGSRRSSKPKKEKGSPPSLKPRSRSSRSSVGLESTESSNRSTPALDMSQLTPPLTPPPLEHARLYTLSPPDSPPPLVHATLPATLHLLDSTRSLPTSPHASYSSMSQAFVPMSTQPTYQYKPATSAAYHDQPQPLSYAYVNTAPPSVCHTPVNNPPSSYSAYPSPHQEYTQPDVYQQMQSREVSPENAAIHTSTRHSMSGHSSYDSYSYSGANTNTTTTTPPSPASHNSSSPAPTYQLYNVSAYPTATGVVGDGQMAHSHTHTHTGYQHSMPRDRFESPPPTLAPLHGRYVRRDDSSHQQQPVQAQYIHHPQPVSTDYSYNSSSSLVMSHNWRTENSLRQGLAAMTVQ